MSMTAIARMEMDRRKASRAEEHASALTSAGGPWQLKMGGGGLNSLVPLWLHRAH